MRVDLEKSFMLTVENCLFWSEFSVLAAGVLVDDSVVVVVLLRGLEDSEVEVVHVFVEELFSDRNNNEVEKLSNNWEIKFLSSFS